MSLASAPGRSAFFEKCCHGLAEVLACIAGGHEIVAGCRRGATMCLDPAYHFFGGVYSERRVSGNGLSDLSDGAVEVSGVDDMGSQIGRHRLLGVKEPCCEEHFFEPGRTHEIH